MNHITVRLAAPSDAKALKRLNEAFNEPNLTSEAEIAASILENSNESVFLAELDGRPIGFCCTQLIRSMCYKTPCAELTELYVEEAYRRMGAARAMMEYAEEYMKERFGIDEMHLLTGHNNFPAQAFYQAVGYKPDYEARFVKSL